MSRSNRNIPFSMQSEFDSDAYDSDEFDRGSNPLNQEEDSDSDMLVIDEESEFFDQRRRKTPEAREDSGNQQYMEGYDSEGLVMDYNEDESVFEGSMANGRQCPHISPPLQEVRQVSRVNRSRSESDDEEEEAMDQGGENAPGSPQEVDLLHFAPMYVQDTDEWPKPIRMSNIRLRRNKDFGGDWKEEMGGIDSDHYKSNNHFVWTNQLVVRRGVEVDEEENQYRRDGVFINNERIQRFPQDSFRLKKAKKLGYGLFARRFIARGSFKIVFVV